MRFEQFLEFFFSFLKRKNSHPFVPTNLKELSKKLKYTFQNEDILLQALKHRSYLTLTGEARLRSNERLELLGDAVLGLIVTDYLFETFPEEEEGTLTNFKSILVNGRNLSRVAKNFGLGKYLLLNEAEERSGGRKRVSILADAVEAIIGAVYLDGGLEAAKKIVSDNITNQLEDLLAHGQILNYKSILLEHCQGTGMKGPRYVVESENGPDHKKVFTVAVIVNGEKLGTGEGHSKKNAEQNAAKEALSSLNII